MPRFNAENWPKNRALAEAFNAIAAELEVTPAQLSLAWVLSRGDHIVAIPGTASIAHMEENFARADWTIPAEAAARIDELINERTVSGPRYSDAMQRTIETEMFG